MRNYPCMRPCTARMLCRLTTPAPANRHRVGWGAGVNRRTEMAKYQAERFALAAAAFVDAHPAPDATVDTITGTREACAALAAKVGKDAPEWAGLDAVARLRDSIARRFLRISVAPLRDARAKAAAAAAAREARAAKRASKSAA